MVTARERRLAELREQIARLERQLSNLRREAAELLAKPPKPRGSSIFETVPGYEDDDNPSEDGYLGASALRHASSNR